MKNLHLPYIYILSAAQLLFGTIGDLLDEDTDNKLRDADHQERGSIGISGNGNGDGDDNGGCGIPPWIAIVVGVIVLALYFLLS